MEFFEAIRKGDLNKVRQLVESGTDVNAESEDGYTALNWAAIMSQKEVFAFLKERGARSDVFVETAAGNEAELRRYLDRGGDVNAANAHSHRLLMTAAHQGHESLVRILLEAGAEIEARHATSGNTALMGAAFSGQAGVVGQLLAAGADKTLRNKAGQTARDLALFGGHEALAATL